MMQTVNIRVSDFYNEPKYFPFMPEAVFNALEAAFIEGKETAKVPEEEFNKMILSVQK